MKVDISNGELIDKITILEIKLKRIEDPERLKNVKIEYDILHKLETNISHAKELDKELKVLMKEKDTAIRYQDFIHACGLRDREVELRAQIKQIQERKQEETGCRRTELKIVNEEIWDCENSIRQLTRDRVYDETFIECAKQIHVLNDERARIKKIINTETSSEIIEEKSY